MFSPRSSLATSVGLIALLATACAQTDTAQASSSTAAAGQAATAAAAGPLRGGATTTQVADFARSVGGDKVAVTQILKPNVDPHDYEPSPAGIRAVADADVVVKNGVGLERWLDQVISSAGFKGQVVDASQGVAIRKGDGSAEEAAGDPHIWHNPQNVKIMAANIEKAFAAKDAPDAAAYQADLDAYSAKLDALDADIAQRIDAIPADRRKPVTNHDVSGYYIDRYRLTFVGSITPSFDTSAELSAKQTSDGACRCRLR
ncbi:zinc/manganese transport system substrate-binding protein/manganese/iron transport system substrate-binding protein [Streptosporangium album]|uniref:Zinc/manganese transport system substrate-binding protein/manganese/iron transport system substrate-binding protein n=1 Tax=Streptosporangium album TaxID=47479 RepID=A0A7W7WDL6_9ACTN|nr:metal ABC transporter substrate-binding protein [Streptosporangium album]MBB4943246.1 zinc/manganese transport system substrate-binding protein/manganese/iron transport system substrate-binding protein [Streptosporangium album]